MSALDLQLEAVRNTQHLEALHLEVHTDRRFVVFVKGLLAESKISMNTFIKYI